MTTTMAGPLNIAKEVAALQRLGVKDLRLRYAEVFGDETRTGNKVWLIKRIAWRLQALAEGGLSERARQRALEIANEADLRMSPPKARAAGGSRPAHPDAQQPAVTFSDDRRIPAPGTVITRDYKGRSIQVCVREHGFEYEGGIYRSLSALAKVVTGTHTNGYLFFRLRKADRS